MLGTLLLLAGCQVVDGAFIEQGEGADDNTATITQAGDGSNGVRISQGTTGGAADGNVASIGQAGDDNTASIDQGTFSFSGPSSADGNTASITQAGDENTASIT